MPWTAERTSINARVQIGAEATTALGTVVAASKLLQCYSFQFGIATDVLFYGATGRKYDLVQEENTEWVDGTMTGPVDFNGILYPLAGSMGSVSPVAHLASTTAKDWIYNPPVTGSIVPQTYTFEQGDAIRAHRLAYGLFTKFGYKASRKDFTCDGTLIANALIDGITMTASPTAVTLNPVPAKFVNVYLDPTFGALGTTLLTRVLSIDYQMDGIYAPLWVLNRANLSYPAHVDMKPKATMKLKVEADTAGMAMLGYLQSGTTYFMRVDALGTTAIAADGPGNIFNEVKHDMAVKFGKPTTFQDDQGVFAIEWELFVVEDAGWGHAQQITVTNLLTAL